MGSTFSIIIAIISIPYTLPIGWLLSRTKIKVNIKLLSILFIIYICLLFYDTKYLKCSQGDEVDIREMCYYTSNLSLWLALSIMILLFTLIFKKKPLK